MHVCEVICSEIICLHRPRIIHFTSMSVLTFLRVWKSMHEIGKFSTKYIITWTTTRCGYSTIHNVIDKSHEDRMESFFLSETCKYLYLVSKLTAVMHIIETIISCLMRTMLLTNEHRTTYSPRRVILSRLIPDFVVHGQTTLAGHIFQTRPVVPGIVHM